MIGAPDERCAQPGDEEWKAKKFKPKKRDVSAVIKKLDVTSLHEDDITDVMLHCASALKLKRAMAKQVIGSVCSGLLLHEVWRQFDR